MKARTRVESFQSYYISILLFTKYYMVFVGCSLRKYVCLRLYAINGHTRGMQVHSAVFLDLKSTLSVHLLRKQKHHLKKRINIHLTWQGNVIALATQHPGHICFFFNFLPCISNYEPSAPIEGRQQLHVNSKLPYLLLGLKKKSFERKKFKTRQLSIQLWKHTLHRCKNPACKNKHKAWNSLQKTDVFLAINTSGIAAEKDMTLTWKYLRRGIIPSF